MVAKAQKIINLGLDSDDSLSGGSGVTNLSTVFNTDRLVNGSTLRYEAGLNTEFGRGSDYLDELSGFHSENPLSISQFPNRFFPDSGTGVGTIDSDIRAVVAPSYNRVTKTGGDADDFINNITNKKMATLNQQPPSYYQLNVYRSVDSSTALIDPLNP
jgi:hypothetical protein